jgi:Right handed beta helix region
MKKLLSLFIVLCSLTAQAQTIRYVKPTAAGTGTGASWANASGNLQTVINASAAGDEVWVAAGTYKPAGYPTGATGTINIKDYAFFVRDGVKLYGSFAGTETAITQRDIPSNRSILSGDIGTIGSAYDDCYHILIAVAPTTNGIGITVDGFDITEGKAYATTQITINGTIVNRSYGGGMILYRGTNTLVNNRIYINGASGNGGGGGGGVHLNGSTNYISNNTIYNNGSSNSSGGGISTYNSKNYITNNTMYNNGCSYGAGGAISTYNGTNHIKNNLIYNNFTDSGNGGAINSGLDTNYISNNTFYRNRTSGSGGAIVTSSCLNTFQNNTIYQNNAYSYGGGLFLGQSTSSFVNNTVYDNSTDTQGGGIYIGAGTNIFTNNVFWKNSIRYSTDSSFTVAGADFMKNDGSADFTAYNNVFQMDSLTYNWGSRNTLNAASSGNKFQQNPLFSNENNLLGADGIARTADDGLRLCTNSIGINTGTTSGTNIPTTDITGATRTGNPDIGAYEGGIGTCTVIPTAALIRYVKPTAAGTGDGSSWANASSDLQGMINYVSLNGANSPKQVWVAAGTYYPTQDVNGNTAVAGATFLIKPAVRLYGGFAGTETNLNQRNSSTNVTILSGNIPPIGNGSANKVVTMGSVSNFTLIDGFRVIGGGQTAIICNTGYSIVTNNIVSDSKQGIIVSQGTCYIGNNFIFNNRNYNGSSVGLGGGGGIYNYLGTATVVNNVIYRNGDNYGGAMCSYGGTSTLINNTIYGNEAGSSNGSSGFFATRNANTTFINNVFWGNLQNNTIGVGSDYHSDTNYPATVSVFKNNALQLPATSYTTTNGNSLNTGSANNIFQQNPFFFNPGFLQGFDALYQTADDGFVPCSNSALVNAGLAPSATNGVPTTDMTGTIRTLTDIGAYQAATTACNGNVVSMRFVKPVATGTGDGTSWIDASADIANMLDEVTSGIGSKEVWVAAGTYKPNRSPLNSQNSDPRASCFFIHNDTKLYGGFVGNEIQRSLRNADLNPTILEGDIGVVGEKTDNVYHVVLMADLQRKGGLIDGFHIRNGNATTYGFGSTSMPIDGSLASYTVGGGIFSFFGKATISNNKIYNCFSNGTGGGIGTQSSKAYISNNTIYNNKSISGGNGGSGITVGYGGGRDTIINNTIRDNEGNYGGGIFVAHDTAYIHNNGIYNNEGNNEGGGIHIFGNSSATIKENIIYNNTGRTDGGGIYAGRGTDIINNVINNNNATGEGGGIYFYSGYNASINNNTIVGNWSKESTGGGIYSQSGSGLIQNNILWANKIGVQPSIFAAGADYATPANTNNLDVLSNNILQLASIDYSTANANTFNSGGNNIFQQNPLFVNSAAINGLDNAPFTADDGFRLHTNSPATDAGLVADGFNGIPTEDILGNARLTTDIGAYEGGFQNALLLNNIVRYVSATPGGKADGSSWADATNDLQGVIDDLDINTTGNKQIWVGKGTYMPLRDHLSNSKPTNQRTKTFHLKNGIALYGGFQGNETSLTQRNILANPTLLSGDIGIASNTTDNAYHVILATCRNPQLRANTALAAPGVTIDGFAILNGNANNTISLIIRGDTIRSTYGGGAICLSYGNNRIANNQIYNNATSTNGGAIYLTNSINNIKNNAFYTNTATINGGAIASLFATDTVVNNVFHTNSSNLGGAVCITNNTNNFINNTFYLNNATTNGGAVAVLGNTSHRFKNNIFWDNTKNNANNVANADFYYATATATFYNNCLQLPITNYTAANNNLLAANSTANLFQQNPLFKNTADIDGADNLISTPDDGLRVCTNSIAFNAGTLGADVPTIDLLNAPRIGNPELGAYEGDGCSFINTETNNADYSTITAYPNPSATGVFTIKGTSNANQQIVVTNALGQILHTTLRDNMLYLDHLPQGIYFINFIADKQFVKVISL